MRAPSPPGRLTRRGFSWPPARDVGHPGCGRGLPRHGSLPLLTFLFPVLLLPVVLWHHPRVGIYLLFAAAVTIEMFGYAVGPREGAVTSRIPVFHGVLPGGFNLAEVLLLLTVVIVVMQAVQRRQAWLHRSALARWLAAVLGVVVIFFVLGVSRGGEIKIALWEVRPYFYLAACFILASSLINDFAGVRPLLWILVVGSGVKAAYGLTIFLSVRHVQPRPEAVLAHEESFFSGSTPHDVGLAARRPGPGESRHDDGPPVVRCATW